MSFVAFKIGQRCIYSNGVNTDQYCVILEQMPMQGVFKIMNVSTKEVFFSHELSLSPWRVDSNNLLKDVL